MLCLTLEEVVGRVLSGLRVSLVSSLSPGFTTAFMRYAGKEQDRGRAPARVVAEEGTGGWRAGRPRGVGRVEDSGARHWSGDHHQRPAAAGGHRGDDR